MPHTHGLMNRLRGLVDAGLHIAQIRLQLLSVELQEEKLRLVTLLFSTVFAVLMIGFGLVFLTVFITVLLWDEYRLLTLGVASFVFLIAGLIAVVVAIRELRRGSQLFSATVDELANDREALEQQDELPPA